jgi:hypothetical protein
VLRLARCGLRCRQLSQLHVRLASPRWSARRVLPGPRSMQSRCCPPSTPLASCHARRLARKATVTGSRPPLRRPAHSLVAAYRPGGLRGLMPQPTSRSR